MPNYKVKVKWGREQFPDIDVNTDEDPVLFKAQLFALTGVHPERQKVMYKGGILKDNEWNLQMKEGATVLLLGTKEEVPQQPEQPVKFLEDMNDQEMASAMELPAGLTNLGNTCYMNATVQCLHVVPELREALNEFRVESQDASSLPMGITSSMKFLFKQMERGTTVTPILLLQTLHRASPQFSQTGDNGTYRQQDANECWSELLKMLQQKLPPLGGDEKVQGEQANSQVKKHKSFIEQYFGGTFEVKMSNTESEDEPATVSSEQFLQLSCFISPEVKYMNNGLKSKMKETLVKRSEILGRDANYTRSYLISRLPAYLTVQFVRFQYKGKEGINAKVLKDIKFPIDFDAFELCTPAMQEKLTPIRAKFKELEDSKIEKQINQDGSTPMEKPKDDGAGAAAAKKDSDKPEEVEQYWFDNDLGSNNSGYYTLQAVLTHKGRSSSSGHYVAWVKHKDEVWFKFDDDVVSTVTQDEILRLSGGGDWHCAYVLLYGPKLLPKQSAVAKTSETSN